MNALLPPHPHPYLLPVRGGGTGCEYLSGNSRPLAFEELWNQSNCAKGLGNCVIATLWHKPFIGGTLQNLPFSLYFQSFKIISAAALPLLYEVPNELTI
jgi:hypothetical protein